MKEFLLLNSSKEIINTVKCQGIEEAIEYFAEVKRLVVSDLLECFDVVVSSDEFKGGTSRKNKRV
jgi:hypothetical protein